jgi:hypothetical protein
MTNKKAKNGNGRGATNGSPHPTPQVANTQFLVTAHSPLIVQAAASANLAVLRGSRQKSRDPYP